MRSGLPAALDKWLVPVPDREVARDIPSLRIALGPCGAYFAFDKHGSAWGSLPNPMNEAIEARRDAKGSFNLDQGPASVSLGPDGAYVFITTGGGGFWNLQGQNDVLQRFLQERKSLHGVVCLLTAPFPFHVFCSRNELTMLVCYTQPLPARHIRCLPHYRRMCR